MKVKDVMTKDPVCCRLTDTTQEIAKILRDDDIGSVPIISENRKLEGIIKIAICAAQSLRKVWIPGQPQ
jgi:CBS domain-containing protein